MTFFVFWLSLEPYTRAISFWNVPVMENSMEIYTFRGVLNSEEVIQLITNQIKAYDAGASRLSFVHVQ